MGYQEKYSLKILTQKQTTVYCSAIVMIQFWDCVSGGGGGDQFSWQ